MPRAGRGERTRRRAGREQRDVAVRRRRAQLDRAVERQEVGVELVAAARPSAAASSTAARRQLVAQPLLRVDARDEIRLVAVPPQRLRRPRADRREVQRRVAPAGAPSSCAPFGLVTISQSYAPASIGSSPSGSIRMSGQHDDLVAERLERAATSSLRA